MFKTIVFKDNNPWDPPRNPLPPPGIPPQDPRPPGPPQDLPVVSPPLPPGIFAGPSAHRRVRSLFASFDFLPLPQGGSYTPFYPPPGSPGCKHLLPRASREPGPMSGTRSGAPKAPPRVPKGPPRGPKGSPRDSQGPPRSPQGAPRDPKGPPRAPKGPPRDPQGTPKGPQGIPKGPP